MRKFKFQENSLLDEIKVKDSLRNPEANITLSSFKSGAGMDLMNAMKSAGFDAEPILSGEKPSLRVKGFRDTDQLLDAIPAKYGAAQEQIDQSRSMAR